MPDKIARSVSVDVPENTVPSSFVEESTNSALSVPEEPCSVDASPSTYLLLSDEPRRHV